MKTNSSKRRKPLHKENTFHANLNTRIINNAARLSGFKSRSDGKITAVKLITGFMRMVSKGLKSYQAWANELSLSTGASLSKQGVQERMNIKTEKMLKSVFQEHLHLQLTESSAHAGKFKSIKLEDCTHINLPEDLAAFYPGNVSRGKEKAQAKIHALYDLSTNAFSFLNLHCFRDNDQSLASDSLKYLNANDLILRDLGFLVLQVIEKYIKKGVFFITRKKHGICVYDESGKKLELKKYLKKKRFFDGHVLVGGEKIKMRMVILPVSSEIADQRRRKAKKDRDRRSNHSNEYYELLGYTFLLTNIPKDQSSSQEIMSLYGLRWKIETIFKAWKTCFNLEKIIPQKCKNTHRINAIIYLMLLYIILFQRVYCKHIKKSQSRNISLMKLASIFSQFMANLEFFELTTLAMQITRRCSHEKRKSRQNAEEKYHKIAA